MASSVELTERAARRVHEILKTEPPGSMLRVSSGGRRLLRVPVQVRLRQPPGGRRPRLHDGATCGDPVSVAIHAVRRSILSTTDWVPRSGLRDPVADRVLRVGGTSFSV